MKRAMRISLIVIGIALAMGASLPSGSDKEMIVRLQGEVLVLQRQIRDLQESIDRSHAVSMPAVEKAAGLSEESLKKLSTIEDRLSQTGSLQHNSLSGVVSRLKGIEEQSSTTARQVSELLREMKDVRAAVERSQTRTDTGRQP